MNTSCIMSEWLGISVGPKIIMYDTIRVYNPIEIIYWVMFFMFFIVKRVSVGQIYFASSLPVS